MKFITLFLLLLSASVEAQDISNYRKALSVLEEAIKTTGGYSKSLLITAKGKVYNMGHYEKPEATKEFLLEEEYAYFPSQKNYYIFSKRVNAEDSRYTYYRLALSNLDSVYEKGYYSSSVVKTAADAFILDMAKRMPSAILNLAYENRKSLRYMGIEDANELLSFSYTDGQLISLHISQATKLVEKISVIEYDDVLGDGLYETVFEKFMDIEGAKIPMSRKEFEFGRLEREVSYESPAFNIQPDTTRLRIKMIDKSFRKKAQKSANTKETFNFTTLSPTIDLVKITSQNNKILVGIFSTYISLFEVPQGINLNLQLQEELKTRYPDKPLKYIFLTHHHPDHAGGIRAYAHLPITLLTTQGNDAYFEKLLTAPHTLANTYLEKSKGEVRREFIPLAGKKIFKDKTNEVIAFEIGASAAHTVENIVYYFPKAKILWNGDLVFFDEKGTIYPCGARGKSVYDVIQKNNLKVDKIYSSWPLHEQKEFGTVEFLKQLVEAKMK